MVANPPEDMNRINPYLLYEDTGAALTWLAEAFGFSERMRIPGPDGTVMHAEMAYEGGVLMMGSPGGDYQNPKAHGHSHSHLYIYVDDVDAHHERAKAAGAVISEEPADQFYGDRRYMCEDPEGHSWAFATHVRDVPPEEMTPG